MSAKRVTWASWSPVVLNDGYEHQRDEQGACRNCGASAAEPHYRLRKKEDS